MPPNYGDHVLVASPSSVVRQRVLEGLSPRTRRIEQATGGAEALLHLEKGLWQKLFLDRRLLDLDAEELCQTVRQRFLRVVFDCRLVSAEHLTYREFLQRVPEKTYLASCDLAPFGSLGLLQFDLGTAFPIIDIMLGGEGKSGDTNRELTEIEEQILEGVVRIICRELQTSWQAIKLEFNFVASQQISQVQRLMPPDEKNLCLSFEIKLSESSGTLNVAIPALVSNTLLRKISADNIYQRPRIGQESREQIRKRLLDCPFSVDLMMSDLEIPLENLFHISPGDVLQFQRSVSAPAMMVVEEVPLCSATPVRVHTRRAARVLVLEPHLPSAGGA
jgi:flagellar motor switch protein FliM